MRTATSFLAAAGLVLAAACNDPSTPTGPAPSADLVRGGGAVHVSVMSRNLYIGFDADAAVAALASGDPAVYGPVLQASIATLMNTDFHVRARVIAEEIARTRPDAVGVQEAYLMQVDLSALGGSGTIDLDYVAILQAALAERHLPYQLVATLVDTDMQPLPGVRIVDREALFVDASRVQVGPGVIARTFQYNIGPIAPGIDKKAGYIVAPVTIEGMSVTLATTHLESDLGPGTYDLVAPLRYAQAAEIAAVIGAVPKAVIVGDLNDVVGSLMYQALTGAGFTDTWAALRPRDPGLTDNCFAPDLADRSAHCVKRIDFVFARGLEHPRAGLLGEALLVGVQPWERVQGPAGWLWPSDHAGVVGDFVVPPATGLRN